MKKELKQNAQDDLLHWAASAFQSAYDNNASEEHIAALRVQFQRIEKLFGYEPGSHKF
jgi:hypothetical protein